MRSESFFWSWVETFWTAQKIIDFSLAKDFLVRNKDILLYLPLRIHQNGSVSHPDRKMPLGKAFVLGISRNNIKLSKNCKITQWSLWLLTALTQLTLPTLCHICIPSVEITRAGGLRRSQSKSSVKVERQRHNKEQRTFMGASGTKFLDSLAWHFVGELCPCLKLSIPLITSLSVSVFCSYSKFLVSNSSKWNFSAFILCPPFFPPSLHCSFFFLSAPKSTKEPNRTSLSI